MKKVFLALMLLFSVAMNAAEQFVTFKGGEGSLAVAKSGQVLNIVGSS